MDCLFCKIVAGEAPSVKIWEDDKHLAILDVNPNTRGMTLLLTKDHYSSDMETMPIEEIKNFSASLKTLAGFLKKGLKVQRVAVVMEGTGINHAHVKLYPMHKGEHELEETKDTVFFDVYPGYISTQLGPRALANDLEKLAEEIKNNQ